MNQYRVVKIYIIGARSMKLAKLWAGESRMMRLVDIQVSRCAKRSQARALPSAREVNRKGSKR